MRILYFLFIFLFISAIFQSQTFAVDDPLTTFAGHTDFIYDVIFSPDGDLLASKSKDGTIRIWHVDRKELLRTIHTSQRGQIAFSPDGNVLAGAGGTDKVVNLWDPNTGELLRTLEEHSDNVENIAFSPDGDVLASTSSDGWVRLWNVQTGHLIRTFRSLEDVSIVFKDDGSILTYDVKNHQFPDKPNISVWELETRELLYTVEPDVSEVFGVTFSPDRGNFVSASWGGVDLWDADTGELIRPLPIRSQVFFRAAFSPDGRILAGTRDFGVVEIWEAETGSHLRSIRAHSHDAYAIEFSPDGRTLATTGGWDHLIRLWHITPIGEVEPPQPPDFLADKEIQTWVEDFDDGHLKSWTKRELQRERVTWQTKNGRLHGRTVAWCNQRLNLGEQLAQQTNYTFRFTAFPIDAEQLSVKLSIHSTSNAHVGIFMGKDPHDDLTHPLDYAYQFANHRVGSPEVLSASAAPEMGFSLDEIEVVFDRGHFYLYSDDEYITDFDSVKLKSVSMIGIVMFPKSCLKIAEVVVDDFVVLGPSVFDAGRLDFHPKNRVTVLWGDLKQH